MNAISNETRDTFTSLRDLTKARDSLPIDWGRFNELFGDINDDDSLEELEARALTSIVGACTRPGMTTERARTVGDLLAVLADVEAEARDIPPDELCALLRELQAADDLEGLDLVLFKLAPHDGAAYIARLQVLADATDSDEPHDPDRLRLEQIAAMQASAKPGRTIGAELAGAVVDAALHWHRLKTETPEKKAIREAFAEARRLIDLYGDEDPRAFSAIVKAIELQDPGICDRKLVECGITLPAPTHVNAEGEGLLTLEQVAAALGADAEDLIPRIEEMEAAGLNVRQRPAGMLQ